MPKIPERWLPIANWPYEVSNHGQVRSLRVYRKAGRAGWQWRGGKILKATLFNYRVTVSLHNERGEQWTAGVATLVLRTFVGPPREGQVARHYFDPDPANCALWNLRWGTEKENKADQLRHYGKYHSTGTKHSEQTKRKIGESNRGKHSQPLTAEHRTKLSKAQRDYVLRLRTLGLPHPNKGRKRS